MTTPARMPIVLGPGQGRLYPMGRVRALFQADGAETNAQYSISQWWLESYTQGPGAHKHEEDDVFFVIAGTMHVLIGSEWTAAGAGTLVVVPAGMVHDFENRSAEPAGVLNFSIPGGFEQAMPEIVQWYEEHPAGDVAVR
jgi:mannose-6-phosphate isomerase-like protein (cupin superfamily)